MNPRQRRGVLLMLVASIGAVAVFVSVLGYVSSVRAEVGDFRTILQLTKNVRVNKQVTADMVKQVKVPKRWLGGSFVTDTNELTGKVAANDLHKGEYLTQSMVTDAPALRPGQREIAILIDAETGVAGKVQPGSVVDVYATYQAGTLSERACAKRVLSSTRVIDVGLQRQQQETDKSGQINPTRVVPVTFALSSEEALDLTFAESFGTKVRLALIGPGSSGTPKVGEVCSPPPGRGGAR